MKYKGAIFDMDGLLFDTECLYQETWRELAEKYHVNLTPEFPREISGTNGKYMLAIVEKYYHVEDGSFLVDECMENMRQKLEKHVPLKAGVHEILQCFCEQGIRLAVASSSAKKQIEMNLQKAGIMHYFDEIVSGEEVEHGKPAPDIFQYAAEKINCKPEECYVFEDSINGIKAGHAAGCAAIMIPDLIEPSPEIVPKCSGIYKTLLEAKDHMGTGYF